MYRKILALFLILTLLTSCSSASTEEDSEFSEPISESSVVAVSELDRENTLEVFMVGMPVSWGDEGDYHTTMYQMGDLGSNSYTWGEKGHIYYDALNNYQKESALDVRITYGQYDELWNYLLDGNAPDLIVSDTRADITELMAQEEFLDLLPYFEKDSIYESGNYVNPVLEAGLYFDQQYVFPLTFTMNALITSEQSLARHDLMLSSDYTFDDMVNTFTNAYREVENTDDKHFLTSTANGSAQSIAYQIFSRASGQTAYNPKTGKVVLDEDYFKQMAELYEAFICYDLQMNLDEIRVAAEQESLERAAEAESRGLSPEEVESCKNYKYLNTSEKNSRYARLFYSNAMISQRFELTRNAFACVSDSGESMGDMGSTLTQAYYYESRYTDAEEDFMIIGIPEKEDPESYSATITMFGVIPTEAIHPDEAYELLKTLADAEIFPHFGMSVNRDRLNETFDYFTSTHYDYYAFQMPDPAETIEMGAEYQIKPMSEETSQYLQDMVENIDRVVLPNADEFRILQNAVEKYIYDYDFTLDAAYDLAVSNLELYYSGTLTPEEEYNLVWNH